MVDIIEQKQILADLFTMQRDTDSPVQGRIEYTPEAWAALTAEQRDANRQAWFAAWQANTDLLQVVAQESARIIATAASAAANEVPESVSAPQLHRAIWIGGLHDTWEQAVANGPDFAIEAWYKSAVVFRDDDAVVGIVAGALGLTEEQIDDLFRTAAAQ